MQVTLEKTSDLEGRIKVEVTENDYLDKVNKELKEIGRTRQIPGFRPGHVSLDQLRRRFGKDVKSHVLNEEVFRAVIDYLRENKIDILGEPLPVEVKEVNLNDKDYTFEYEIGLAPEVEVDLTKDFHAPFYTIEVAKDMVDQQDAALRERFGAQVPGEEFEDDALVKGAIEQLDENGNVMEVDGAIQVTNGIIAPMYFKSDDQKSLFKGAKVGDKITFNPWATCNGDATELSSMLQVDKSRVADLHNDFRFTISEIIVVRPAEHNQEFFDQVFGKDKVSDENGYRDAIREMIARELKQNSEMVFRVSARNYFLGKYGSMELPSAVLKKWLIMRNEGLNESNIDEEYTRMEPDLKWQLIKESIAQKLQVKIEESDLIEMAKGIAARQFAQYGMTNMDDETLTNYAKNILADKNYRPRLVEQCGDFKLFQGIENGVTLDSETVSLDKFKEIASAL